MSLDLIAKIGELVPNPDCVYKVLTDVLPHCNVPSEVTQRTWLGVQLSVCEFEAAGIEYPPSCNQFATLMECTSALESRSTWWTTFSGSYRHISTICSEHQAQYELHNTVQLYQNISKIFYQHQFQQSNALYALRQDFSEAMNSAKRWKSAVEAMAQDIGRLKHTVELASTASELVSTKMSSFGSQVERANDWAGEVGEGLAAAMQMVSNLGLEVVALEQEIKRSRSALAMHAGAAADLEVSLHALGNTTELLSVREDQFGAKLEHSIRALDDFREHQAGAYARLEDLTTAAAERIIEATNQLENTMDKFKGFLRVFRSFGEIVFFVGYIILASTAAWVATKFKRSATDKYEDMAFY